MVRMRKKEEVELWLPEYSTPRRHRSMLGRRNLSYSKWSNSLTSTILSTISWISWNNWFQRRSFTRVRSPSGPTRSTRSRSKGRRKLLRSNSSSKNSSSKSRRKWICVQAQQNSKRDRLNEIVTILRQYSSARRKVSDGSGRNFHPEIRFG